LISIEQDSFSWPKGFSFSLHGGKVVKERARSGCGTQLNRTEQNRSF